MKILSTSNIVTSHYYRMWLPLWLLTESNHHRARWCPRSLLHLFFHHGHGTVCHYPFRLHLHWPPFLESCRPLSWICCLYCHFISVSFMRL